MGNASAFEQVRERCADIGHDDPAMVMAELAEKTRDSYPSEQREEIQRMGSMVFDLYHSHVITDQDKAAYLCTLERPHTQKRVREQWTAWRDGLRREGARSGVGQT